MGGVKCGSINSDRYLHSCSNHINQSKSSSQPDPVVSAKPFLPSSSPRFPLPPSQTCSPPSAKPRLPNPPRDKCSNPKLGFPTSSKGLATRKHLTTPDLRDNGFWIRTCWRCVFPLLNMRLCTARETLGCVGRYNGWTAWTAWTAGWGELGTERGMRLELRGHN
jgi:hypothetical protein